MFKKKEGPVCHHDKKPCIKEQCVKWQSAPVEKMIDGVMQTVSHSDCADVWVLLYLKGIAMRTDGTQIAVESARNEARQDAQAVSAGLIAVANALRLAPGAAHRVLTSREDVAQLPGGQKLCK